MSATKKITSAPAYAVESSAVGNKSVSPNSLLQNEEQVEEILRAIGQIPESVLLQGDEATQQWVILNLGSTTHSGLVEPSSFLGCSGTILVGGAAAALGAELLGITAI